MDGVGVPMAYLPLPMIVLLTTLRNMLNHPACRFKGPVGTAFEILKSRYPKGGQGRHPKTMASKLNDSMS